MRDRIKLRIFLVVLTLAGLSLTAGFFATTAIGRLLELATVIVDENVASLKAAEELELALLSQRGQVAYYLLSGDRYWLEVLERRKEDFASWLEQADRSANVPEEQRILNRIREEYRAYDDLRDRAVSLYDAGRREEAREFLLGQVNRGLETVYLSSEEFIAVNDRLVAQALMVARQQAANVLGTIWFIELLAFVLGAGAGWMMMQVLVKAQRELAQSRRMADMGRFASTVAHELRNPLADMKTSLSIMKRKTHDRAVLEGLQRIERKVGESDEIISNMLGFARIRVPDLAPLEMCELLRESVRSVRDKYAQWEVVLHEDVPHGENCLIRADRGQLKMVFLNILNNAYQALPDRKGEVRVRLHSDRHECRVSISDTGVGISRKRLATIFEPFMSTKSTGTGLGLALSREIVELHRGRIDVESREGQGATFTVVLPGSGR